MALTPEDVVNKRFQSTKFREGYDQDEVDDFLDEVVVELRRLTAENEELKARVSSGGGASESVVEAAPAAEAVAEPVAAPVAVAAAAPASAEPVDETAGTTNLLQLARRLHEEHVKEGAEKRDALIAEGHATAARLVAEAEAKQRAQLTVLDQERSVLETKIDDLRTFEREYRQKLKSYIETQLHDLDATSPVEASNASKPSYQSFGA
ncbi:MULTISPECIES: DivIVA domain-containing protein [Cryobacterium]|uniref:Cell wall synthesis protein Wag31 n=1 Tax=Cryobacterium breve TaxID=1259258 RepID=A0ABY2IYR3_9MICO|nr:MULTISPECIES: DivIVA domain-containing protein [Cryobacterium]TFC96671.1 DivIVA domain-containing protein [Cryobacterium sp. TmT3-12]TFC97532.1 DivIVA domain-containing protein [Cryobacterium breve]